MKRLSLIIVLILVTCYVSSCSQKLPVPNSDDNGILVIPISSRNTTQYQNGYYYEFVYSPKTNIQIKAVPMGNRKFVVIDGFPPGEYKINAIKSISSPSGGVASVSSETIDFNNSIPIQIRSNEITLLEYMFSVEQKFSGQAPAGHYSQGYIFKPLDESQYDQVLSELKQLPNAEHWNLAHLPASPTTNQDNGVTSVNKLSVRLPSGNRN